MCGLNCLRRGALCAESRGCLRRLNRFAGAGGEAIAEVRVSEADLLAEGLGFVEEVDVSQDVLLGEKVADQIKIADDARECLALLFVHPRVRHELAGFEAGEGHLAAQHVELPGRDGGVGVGDLEGRSNLVFSDAEAPRDGGGGPGRFRLPKSHDGSFLAAFECECRRWVPSPGTFLERGNRQDAGWTNGEDAAKDGGPTGDNRRPPMRLLCTGDLHIGRRSAGTSGDGFSCGEAWERLAALAAGDPVDGVQIPRVDAVLISGDVTDQDNRYFQAIGPFERGLARLHRAGIDVVGVAGNHDHDTLREVAPRLRREYGFRLLGGDGWESVILDRDGERLRVIGWSYPAAEHPRCPLHDLTVEASSIPTVGLVHVQRGGPDGRFAYARDEDLRAHSEVDLWVIGHVHAPRSEFSETLRVVNPGSPQAMDFGEGDWHGASVVQVRGKSHLWEAERLGASTAWYGRVAVELHQNALSDLAGIREYVREMLAERRDEFLAQSACLRYIEFRIDLVGTSNVSREALDGLCRDLVKGVELRPLEGEARVRVAVSRATAHGVRPLRDLDQYARSTGPVAVLARTLRALASSETLSPEVANLMAQLAHAARQRAEHSRFAPALAVPPPNEETLRRWAVEEGYALLERLLAQNPETAPVEVMA